MPNQNQIENGVKATLEGLANEFKTDRYQKRSWKTLWESAIEQARAFGTHLVVRPEYPGNPHKKPSTTV
jgi:hypothetical protein